MFPELLRIDSRNEQGRTIIIAFLAGIFLLFFYYFKDVVNFIKGKAFDQQFVLAFMAALFLAALVGTIFKINRARRKTLIMTEKGFYIEPMLAEFWNDIAEYKWNTVQDASGNPIAGSGKEKSLLLFFNNQGSSPGICDLAQYGIFFTTDQIQQVERHCLLWGIKKIGEQNIHNIL